MIALGRALNLAAIVSAVTLHVAESTSGKTGIAPW
jgi:hypothetical protein